MNGPPATYLHDHLTGSHFAINLVTSLSEQFRQEVLGIFAVDLRGEVLQDQDTLKELVERVSKSHIDLSQATGWLVEKASQFKLEREHSGGGIGTFEALETVTLGIQGKKAL